jgi:hypothetical protein
MGRLGTLSANALALLTGRAGAAAGAGAAGLELATVLLEDVFEVAVPEVLDAVADEFDTATVLPEFVFATEFLEAALSALFESEDFPLLERTGKVFAGEPVPLEVLVADAVEVFVLGLVGKWAAFDWASGCFEFNAVAESGTAFDSTGTGSVAALETAPSTDSPRGLSGTTTAGFVASPLVAFAACFAFTSEALFAGSLARAAATTDCRSGCPGCVSPSLELFWSVGDFGTALAST